jgi:hypothetical protein
MLTICFFTINLASAISRLTFELAELSAILHLKFQLVQTGHEPNLVLVTKPLDETKPNVFSAGSSGLLPTT